MTQGHRTAADQAEDNLGSLPPKFRGKGASGKLKKGCQVWAGHLIGRAPFMKTNETTDKLATAAWAVPEVVPR